ncbi:ATP--guanido phosphotransferase [bacterium]|nr:ATP--guanido phosphotransferase [bacterium]
MNWYLQSGKDSDVVTSTRIRFARNLQGFKFNLKNQKDIEELKNKIKENTYAIGYGLKYLELKDMDDITKMSLVEKNLISKDYALKNKTGAILINDEENICIIINDDDHLKVQVFSSGFELENTLNFAIELDKKIEEVLGYATSKKYGYLTSMPTNCGTGLKASVMVSLPALEKTRNIDKVFYNLSNFGINILELNNAFEISNKRTLGITEEDIIQNIKVVTEKLIEQERNARKFLDKDKISLEDTIYRSYGLLTNCRKITLEETEKLLSNVKIGTDLGILPELTDSKIQKMYLYSKPANMQKYLGEQYETFERDIKRAEVIKNIIKEK